MSFLPQMSLPVTCTILETELRKTETENKKKKVGTGVFNHVTAIPLEVLVLTSKL